MDTLAKLTPPPTLSPKLHSMSHPFTPPAEADADTEGDLDQARRLLPPGSKPQLAEERPAPVILQEGSTEESARSERHPQRLQRLRDDAGTDDAGIIRCICDYTHDDGNTIQCETCSVWQHFVCVGITKATIEDEYFCDRCQPRQLDRSKARALQTKMLSGHVPGRRKRGVSRGKAARGLVPKDQATRRPKLHQRQSSTNSRQSPNGDYFSSTGISEAGEVGSDADELAAPAFQYEYLPLNENRIANPKVFEILKSFPKSSCPDITVYTRSAFDSFKPAKTTLTQIPLPVVKGRSIFSGHSRFGLVSAVPVPRERYIAEYIGEIGLQSDYVSDPYNRFNSLGIPRAHVYFDPNLPLYVDTRQLGSTSRFIRRSCRANSTISTIMIEPGNEIHFAIFSSEQIPKDTEITVDWPWPEGHPARKNFGGEELDDAERKRLISIIDEILSNLECGCGSSRKDCGLAVIRRDLAAINAKKKGRKLHRIDREPSAAAEDDESRDSSHAKTSRDQTPISDHRDAFISSREERKIMARIEQMEEQEVNRKRKRTSTLDSQSKRAVLALPEPPSLRRTKPEQTFVGYDNSCLPYHKLILRKYRETFMAKGRQEEQLTQEHAEPLPEDNLHLHAGPQDVKTLAPSLMQASCHESPPRSDSARTFREDNEQKPTSGSLTATALRPAAAEFRVDLPPPPTFQSQPSSLQTPSVSATPTSTMQSPFAHCTPGALSSPGSSPANPMLGQPSPMRKTKKLSLSEYGKRKKAVTPAGTPGTQTDGGVAAL